MKKELVPVTQIAQSIHFLRGQKVMLDLNLAGLYCVTTKVFNQAVKRNISRFPEDFMFQVSPDEDRSLRSQIVTLKRGEHRKYRPYAFTEQGVAMLSSVLKSDRPVKVNIAIMRAFVKLRAALETNRDLAEKFAKLDEKVGKHDHEIAAIIDAIRQLTAPPKKSAREIGFHVRESSPRYGTRARR